METDNRLSYLWRQYLDDNASDGELAELWHWIRAQPNDKEAQNYLAALYEPANVSAEPDKERLEAILSRIAALRDPVPAQPTHFLRQWWWAAAVILVCSAGAFFWFNNSNKPSTVAATRSVPAENDVAPGRDGAILTLADGRKVVLDSLGNGIIAVQSGSQVVLKDGQLAYDPSGKAVKDAAFNTMSTPKGRQFKVTLPDGTRVWLNAASSITYPTVFNGKDRPVKITGEAFFEVAKDKQKPFTVKVNDAATVEVLGTHFNVNAYTDEAAIRTTLIEGSVRVNAYDHFEMLKPGQQAQISGHKKIKLVNDPDIEKVIAWKNGYFNFNDADIYEVMRQLERWYDIEVVFAKPVRPIEFSGELPRDLSLSQVLKILAKMRVKFRIEEGKKLVIEP